MADQILQTVQTVVRDPSVKIFLDEIKNRIIKAVDERLAAAGVKPVFGDEFSVPTRPAITEEQKAKLEFAKYRLSRAEKNLKEYQGLLNRFLGFLKGDNKSAVEKEFEEAKNNYEKLKRELGV